jgi:hypothetical protein
MCSCQQNNDKTTAEQSSPRGKKHQKQPWPNVPKPKSLKDKKYLDETIAGTAGNLALADPEQPQDWAVVPFQLFHTAVVCQGPDLDGGIRTSGRQQSESKFLF